MNKSSSLVLAVASATALTVFTSCKPSQPTAEATASPTPAPAATAAATAAPAPAQAAPASTPVEAATPAVATAPAAAPEASPAASAGVELKDPVATVDGEPISKAQLDDAFNMAVKAANIPVDQLPPEQKMEGYRQLLDEMILDKLITKAASGVEVPQSEVDAEIAKIKAQFGNDEAFSKELTAAGQSPEKFTENMKKMLQQKQWVQSKIADQTNVTEADAKKFYDENKDQFKEEDSVKASHILFMVKPEDSEEVSKQKLDAAKKAIVRAKKEDFTKLAKELSEEPGAAESGGDLGSFTKEQMVPEFSTAAFTQKVGTVSTEPVKTQFGYHVIKVTEKKPAREVPFDEVKEKLINYLKKSKEREAVQKLIESIKSSAKIENTLPAPPPMPSMPMMQGMPEPAQVPATEPPGKGN